MDFVSGTRVGPYEIESVIGRGGMGIVYRARRSETGQAVAIKVMSPHLASDPEARERFLRESRVVASLDHPNILSVYDSGSTGATLYIAMKLVEGMDLAEMIRALDGLTPTQILNLMTQTAAALDTAHEAGLVHRDVKPQNMLVATDHTAGGNHLWISDFGLAKDRTSDGSLTSAGKLMGTVHYVAPEILQGEPADGRADLYSLACVVYECLTGQVVFKRESDLAEMWAHVQEAPTAASKHRPDLPTAVDDVLATALEKSPKNRFLTCSEFVNALTQCFEEQQSQELVSRDAMGRVEATRRRRAEAIPDLWTSGRSLSQADLTWKKVTALGTVAALVLTIAVFALRRQDHQISAGSQSVAHESTPEFPPRPGAPQAKTRGGRRPGAGIASSQGRSKASGPGAVAPLLGGGTESSMQGPEEDGTTTRSPNMDVWAVPGPSELIAFARGEGNRAEVYLLLEDGSEKKLTKNGTLDSDPQISPDGTQIAWVSLRSGNPDIWVMNLDGTNPVKLTNTPLHDADPSWSPDGNRIAFASNREGNNEIYTMNADGSFQLRLTVHIGQDGFPAWSPDGKKIAYHSDLGSNWEIMTVRPDGTGLSNVTRNASTHEIYPAWSPDGRRIAFQTVREGDYEIFVMDADGESERNLTNHPGIDGYPSWSPDGSRIAFDSNRDGDNNIFSMMANGRKQRRMTRSPLSDGGPHWGLAPTTSRDKTSSRSRRALFLASDTPERVCGVGRIGAVSPRLDGLFQMTPELWTAV